MIDIAKCKHMIMICIGKCKQICYLFPKLWSRMKFKYLSVVFLLTTVDAGRLPDLPKKLEIMQDCEKIPEVTLGLTYGKFIPGVSSPSPWFRNEPLSSTLIWNIRIYGNGTTYIDQNRTAQAQDFISGYFFENVFQFEHGQDIPNENDDMMLYDDEIYYGNSQSYKKYVRRMA